MTLSGAGRIVTGLLAAALSQPAFADRVLDAGPHDYRSLLPQLQPGDTLRLAPGQYDGLPVHGIRGTRASPIVIRGAGDRTTIVANPSRNTVSVRDVAHVVVRDMRLDGAGHATDGVVCESHSGPVHDVTLENLTIVNFGFDRATVGIATRCTAWNWLIRGNRIVRPGTGMYLGHSDGTLPFFAGLIERNEILEPRGYGIQIKHQIARPDVTGAPAGPSVTVISGNRIIKSSSGSDPADARPNLLVGHFPREGPGARDLYLVRGNVLYDNPTDALFQGEGNVAFYDNILVNTRGDAVNIRPHKDRPRNVFVFNNTVLATGHGITVEGGEPGFERFVTGNAVFAARPFRGDAEGSNFSATYERAANYLQAPLEPAERRDFAPRPRALLGAEPLPPVVRGLPGAGSDFLGRPRTDPVFGACRHPFPAKPLPCR